MTAEPPNDRPRESDRPRRPRSGGGAKRGDHTLSDALDAYLRGQGREETFLLGRICGCWEEVVGLDVATHAVPRALRDGELLVAVDRPGWVTQLAFLAEDILAKLEAQLGERVARSLKATVRGRPGVE